MNRFFKPAILAAVTAALTWLPTTLQAQPPGGGGGGGGRNFDPAQMRQQMMDRYREMMDVKDDTAWSAIEPRIQKVMDARREVGFGGMRGMFGRGGRQGGDTAGGGGGGGGGNRGFGPQPSPAATDLQKSIDSQASTDTIKAKLAAYREDRKQKQANLEKAQDDLKKVLTVKQEAAAVLAGLLE